MAQAVAGLRHVEMNTLVGSIRNLYQPISHITQPAMSFFFSPKSENITNEY